VAAALLVTAPAGWAHAGFVSSDPADGETLPASPDAITIMFTEPPDPAISQVTILDAAGQPAEVGAIARQRRVGLSAPLPDLSDGVYTVNWVVVSTVDGHFTSGTFAFGVGNAGAVPSGTAVSSSPDPTPIGVGGRAALYAGLSLVIATAVVGGWAFGLRPGPLRVVVAAGGILALGGALLALASEVDQVGTTTRTFLGSETGAAYVRLLIAVAATAALALLAAVRTTVLAVSLAGIGAVAGWWARATAGHADGTVQEIGQTVHMTAVSVWIGGLLLLWLLLRERRDEPPVTAVRRYSTLALVAVGVVIVTGSIRVLQETGGLADVRETIDTGYGQVLAVKVALALVLVGLGAVNRKRSIPRIAAGHGGSLTRIVRAEIAVALGIVVLTGALTSLPPGGVDRPAPAPSTQITADGSDFGTTVRLSLTATPGTAGPNAFTVDVTDYDTGEPANVGAVTLRFARAGAGTNSATTSLELEHEGDRWTAEGPVISIAGTWNVTAQVRAGDETVDVPLVLTTTTVGTSTSVAEIPGQPSITTITYRDGRSAQLYVDPGSPGPNQIHVTAFDAAGAELQLGRASLAVVPPTGPAAPTDVLRLGPGHLVANVELEPGAWVFDFTAVPVEGDPMQATLRTTIGPSP
jgi:copper transport protein